LCLPQCGPLLLDGEFRLDGRDLGQHLSFGYTISYIYHYLLDAPFDLRTDDHLVVSEERSHRFDRPALLVLLDSDEPDFYFRRCGILFFTGTLLGIAVSTSNEQEIHRDQAD